ncbi:ribonuclease H-like protein [Hygrophoropsis aurantiaca]|uniref:Ribonuclease H-like protein n=1 Tax=Hygrophoropsis aurantiaca TaxID=72124 RepID=A0ACB7ZRW6_9AGAM|nr:ribonuclease H-like protein [Hygrophoropsis aurantiaca]
MSPKYNTNNNPQTDNLTLTHRRKEKNQNSRIQRKGEITFDPTISTKNSIAECFRIFTDPNKLSQQPAYRLQFGTQGRPHDNEHIKIFTDGSCSNNGKQNAKCGAGIWIADDHPLNQSIRIKNDTQSNQVGELVAILKALQSTNPAVPVTIATDSMYAIDGLTKHLTTWEDQGWINIDNHKLFEAIAYHLRRRSAPTHFEWIKGHDGNIGNEKADELAKLGAEKQDLDEIDTNVPDEFLIKGAKLCKITQAIAYAGIRNQKTLKKRRATTINLDMSRHNIVDTTDTLETDTSLWKNIKNKEFSPKIRQFLFKAMHGAYRIGEFWSNIPNFEHRARCSSCNDPSESMEHILTECPQGPQRIIWDLAEKIWPHQEKHPWPRPNIGTILGCGSIKSLKESPNLQTPQTQPKNDKHNKKRDTKARLLTILLIESAYLIWVLRCEKAIREIDHTPESIQNRWTTTINKRINQDRLTAHMKLNKKISIDIIKATWSDIIQQPRTQPDWASTLEVLVGITLPEPST